MKKPRTIRKLLTIYDYSRHRLMKQGQWREFWRDQVIRLRYLDQPYYREITNNQLSL